MKILEKIENIIPNRLSAYPSPSWLDVDILFFPPKKKKVNMTSKRVMPHSAKINSKTQLRDRNIVRKNEEI